MRKLSIIIGLLALAAAAQAQMPPAQVVVDQVKKQTIAPTAQVAGTVLAIQDIRLSAELGGRLTSVASPGTRFEKGDVLAQIDAAPLRLQRQQVAARIGGLEARLEFLDSEVQRLTRLATAQSAAQSLLEQNKADRANAQSNLAAEQAQLAILDDQIDRLSMQAPFAGTVVERFSQAGEWVSVGDAVLRLVNPKALEIIARPPLEHLPFVETGTPLQVTLGDQILSATVDAVIPVGDADTHLFELRAPVDGSPWAQGQTVRVGVPTAQFREVLTVPRDALVLRGSGTAVFILEGETAKRVAVNPGVAQGNRIELVDTTLVDGDAVIVRGNERLMDGQTVMVQNP